MAFNVNNFRSALPGGGARANLFEVRIPNPAGLSGLPDVQKNIRLLCQTASIPTGTIEQTELNYFGRVYKIAGTRTFEDWEVGIYNDTDFSSRNAIEQWMADIVPLDSSIGPVGYDYMVDRATVSQMSRDDSIIATYEFFNMWPKSIGAIELDTAGGEEVETFTTTFAYSHFERTL